MAEQYNLVSWLILIIFLATVALVVMKKVAITRALPLSGIVIALVAGVPLVNVHGEDIANGIVVKGITDLAELMFVYVLSMMFADFVIKYKLYELIDYLFAYYLAKNKQLLIWLVAVFSIVISCVMVNIGAILFTAILFLPILYKIGFSRSSAIGLLLLAEGVGTCLNPLYHLTYANLLVLPVNYVQNDFYVIAFLTCIALVVFIMVNIYQHKLNELLKPEKRRFRVFALLVLLIPFLLTLLGFNIENGLIVALIYGYLINEVKSPFEQFLLSFKAMATKSLDTLILLGAIGIFINAVKSKAVAAAMVPLLSKVMPISPIWCLLLFTILFPLVLYKGPFNLLGMGSGIYSMMMGTALVNPMLLGTVFLSLNVLCRIVDPLSLKNVALFEFAKVDSNDMVKKIIPYVLGINYVMLFYMLVWLSD